MDVLADLDLEQITDPATRRVIQVLLNLIEDLQAENGRLRVENQRLRDELARLTGGSGRPTIRPQAGKQAPTDHSSERERHTPTRRRPRGKLAELTIHQVEMLAEVLEHGASKYGNENWRLNADISRAHDAYRRHLLAAVRLCAAGSCPIDADSGLLHGAHMLANLMFMLELVRE